MLKKVIADWTQPTQIGSEANKYAASVDWSCEFEPLSGQTFHQDYYPQSLPRFT